MSFQEVGSVEELEDVISDGQTMVVFSKDQCPACNVMGNWLRQNFLPAHENRQLKVVVAKLETVGRDVVSDFGLRTMPTTLLFDKGDEVYRIAGFSSPTPVESAVNKHFALA